MQPRSLGCLEEPCCGLLVEHLHFPCARVVGDGWRPPGCAAGSARGPFGAKCVISGRTGTHWDGTDEHFMQSQVCFLPVRLVSHE